jgi:hypothetical protein
LVLIGSGAWYWYNSNVEAHSTKQIAGTAPRTCGRFRDILSLR